MIYQANTAYNTDRIVEAKCEACGTGIWTRTYRGDPSYGGVGAPAGRTDRRAGAVAGCGGDSSSPQLVDGGQAAELPAELDGVDDAVMTRTAVSRESDLDDEYDACDVPRDSGDRTVVERKSMARV